MKVSKFDPHKHFSVGDWEFESMITLTFKWEDYRIHVDVKNGRVMAIMKQSSTAANSKNTQTPPPQPDNGQYLCSMERQWMFKPID
jgi:hypothetical protein